MMKLFLSALMVAAMCFLLTGCETQNDNTTNNANRSGTTAKMSDSDLEKSIKTKLDSDPQLKDANLSVDADIAKNTATLSGTVSSEALRTKAVDMAKSAHPNLIITDKIDVKPGEISKAKYTEEQAKQEREKAKGSGDTIGDTMDDAWIHTKIVAKLLANTTTPERKINVDVVKNVVTLRGNVDTAEQKAEAERIAKDTDGVKSVNNQLKVATGSKTAKK